MKDDGTLQELQNEWLPELDVDIPVIAYPGAPEVGTGRYTG